MTVKELIEELGYMPQGSTVRMLVEDQPESKLTEVFYEKGNKTVWLEGEI